MILFFIGLPLPVLPGIIDPEADVEEDHQAEEAELDISHEPGGEDRGRSAGAGIGALLSIISGYLTVLAIVGNTTYFFTPQSLIYIPQGMFIGIATCVLSGVYPAWRAADLDPIEALRAE